MDAKWHISPQMEFGDIRRRAMATLRTVDLLDTLRDDDQHDSDFIDALLLILEALHLRTDGFYDFLMGEPVEAEKREAA